MHHTHDPLPGTLTLKVDSLVKCRAKACLQCRVKKRRCDMDRPSCSFCAKRGLKCTYGGKLPPKGRRTRPSYTNQVSDPAQTTQKGISTPVSFKYEGSTAVSSGTATANAAPADRTYRVPPYEMPSNSSSSTFNELLSKSSELSHRSSTAECNSVSDIQAAGMGFFPYNVSGGKLTNKDRKGTAFTNIINSSLYNSGAAPKMDLRELHSYVPDKRTCDELFHRYRASVHPIIPLLDLELMSPLYEAFWTDPTSADIPFYIKLFTIFYAACVSKYEEEGLKQVDKNSSCYPSSSDCILMMNQFVGAAEIALSMYHFPRLITIEGLEASVVLHTVLRNDCRTDDSGSVGTLVRLAQTIELHRDPLNYHNIKDMREVQRRRILWWKLFYLDTTTSLSNRLMPIIVENEYDTLLPSEYSKDPNGNFKLNPIIAFANGKFRWAECTNRILRKAFSLKPMATETIDSLTHDIENLSFYCSSLVQRLLESSAVDSSLQQFTSFAASMVATLADRCHLQLYLAKTQNRKGSLSRDAVPDSPPGYRQYEQVNLKSGVADTSSVGNIHIEEVDDLFTEHQIHLLREFSKYGLMPKNKVFLWEIRKFQPIQALLALLRTLLVRAKEIQSHEDQPFFRKYDFSSDPIVQTVIEAMSTLSYLADHTTQLCKDRWKLLSDLRDATWEKLSIAGDDKASSNSEEGESLDGPTEDWYELLEDLDKIQDIIDENINVRAWDQSAGRFVE